MKRAPLTNRLVEKQIEFLVNGVLSGSATLFIENGEIDSTNAEQAFTKLSVCKSLQKVRQLAILIGAALAQLRGQSSGSARDSSLALLRLELLFVCACASVAEPDCV